MSLLKDIYEFIKKNQTKRLKCLKNIHSSERCFIIGNGPSLSISDLEKIKNEYSFASNRIYGLYNKTDWRPTYYISQDTGVIMSIKKEISHIVKESKKAFFNVDLYRHFPRAVRKNKDVFFFKCKTCNDIQEFSTDISQFSVNGNTVTYGAIQIAVYMGFKKIYLIGVDHNYVFSVDSDGNRYIDNKMNYVQGIAPMEYRTIDRTPKGKDPMYVQTEAYMAAREYCENNGIQIFNATRGGKLDVFERVNFDDIV